MLRKRIILFKIVGMSAKSFWYRNAAAAVVAGARGAEKAKSAGEAALSRSFAIKGLATYCRGAGTTRIYGFGVFQPWG